MTQLVGDAIYESRSEGAGKRAGVTSRSEQAPSRALTPLPAIYAE